MSKFKIWLDEAGVETKREPLTKGRPPLGSTKDADGNLVIRPVSQEKHEAFYIEVDASGKEVSRKLRGKGRPPKGYNLETDGDFAGNYVKHAVVATVPPVVTEVKETTEVITQPVTEVSITVEEPETANV